MLTGYIYMIKNTINGKLYIGKTNNINKRWKSHENDYKNKVGRPIYRAMNKYGFDKFELSIIETIRGTDKKTLNESLCELEKTYIKDMNTKVPNGYNLTDGGEGLSGMKLSTQHKEGIRNSLSGKRKTALHRKNLSESRILKKIPSPNKGKTLSEETKKKISNVKKNQYKGENNPFYGKNHSEETIKIISEKNREYSNRPDVLKHNIENQPNRTPVKMCDIESLEEIMRFDSVSQATKWIAENTKYKGDKGTIMKAVKGQTKQAYGYSWIPID